MRLPQSHRRMSIGDVWRCLTLDIILLGLQGTALTGVKKTEFFSFRQRGPRLFGPGPEINEIVSPILTQWATLNETFVFGGGAIMDTVSLIGVDLGKHSFHLHAQDASGRMVWRKKSTRTQMFKLLGNIPACVAAMEACAGAHWIARRIQALGHEARLISPCYVAR